MTAPLVARTVAELREIVAGWRKAGETVGLTPTMGSLHRGHISLVETAQRDCDRVITTIFVNPTQFGPNEDLDAYPRTWDSDYAMLEQAGVDAVFAPTVTEMYPEGFATRVIVDGTLTSVLCAAARPGHMDGVTQIVAKLLNQAGADRAYFGEKDWQQLTVIRRMATDLDIPTAIVGVPTVRERGGLALSSRNAYLSDAQREVAKQFNVILRRAAAEVAAGAAASEACAKAAEDIVAAGFERVDYVEIRDANSLAAVEHPAPETSRIFGAAFLGKARLIDNHPV